MYVNECSLALCVSELTDVAHLQVNLLFTITFHRILLLSNVKTVQMSCYNVQIPSIHMYMTSCFSDDKYALCKQVFMIPCNGCHQPFYLLSELLYEQM